MQLLYSPMSPFARKVRVVAFELGLASRLELVVAAPYTDDAVRAINPLSKIPVLIPDAGPPIPECKALIATVVRATRCDRIPVDMKQRLTEQIRIVARSAAVADPEARELLVESCRITRDEIVDTLTLVGCAR